MTFDFYGNRTENGKINYLVDYLAEQKHYNWNYCGLIVDINTTVDYTNQNVLARWIDKEDGFSDKIIITSLDNFATQFKGV